MLECNLISIISVGSRGESNVLKGHTGAVRSVRFSRDCRHLITASNDKLIKVSFDDWNVIWKIMSKCFYLGYFIADMATAFPKISLLFGWS